jgi:hypothetical protein
LVAANTSLVVAVLVYMGWSYTDALFGYFHVRPLDLGIGIVEYILRSLSLFSPAIVFAAATVVIAVALRGWGPNLAKLAARTARRTLSAALATGRLRRLASLRTGHRPAAPRSTLAGLGAAMTAAALLLALVSRYIQVSTYVMLALLGGGLVLMTRPNRSDHPGRIAYALAVLVASICGLWAASIYAHNVGTGAAENLARSLPSRAAVAVYSIQPLDLTGPGITEQHFGGQLLYHYRYTGFRLLITRSGTYYLLPVGWSPQYDITYVLNDSGEIRVEIY